MDSRILQGKEKRPPENPEDGSPRNAGATGEASTSKTHLLIVEDEPTIRQLFSALLTNAGYSVAEADDGFAALEELRRKRPALILSDLNMPRMTGFELLSVVRRRFPHIHVIAMSGAFSGDSVPQGVSADAFYEKSGRHISTLVDVIEGILANSSAAGTGGGSEERSAQTVPAASVETTSADSPVALWVTRRGNPIEGPYILLNCQECLRSFPFFTDGDQTMEVQSTPCVFCGSEISYALLDCSISHHPGFAPAETP